VAYVSISRGQFGTQIFTDSLEKLPKALRHDVSQQSAPKVESPASRRWYPAKVLIIKGGGERAGARTQDQRLKRAMLYQLSYPLVLQR
jgi:hypothetical protein